MQGGEPFTIDSWSHRLRHEHAMGSTMWWYVVGTGGDIVVSTVHSTVDSMLAIYAANAAPDFSTYIGCWDDNAGAEDRHVRLPNTVAGARYLVQTGRCGSFGGPPTWTACGAPAGSTPSPPSRMTTAPSPRPPRTARTPTRRNGAARRAASCQGRAFGATVWYRWTAPAHGTLTVRASASTPRWRCSAAATPLPRMQRRPEP